MGPVSVESVSETYEYFDPLKKREVLPDEYWDASSGVMIRPSKLMIFLNIVVFVLALIAMETIEIVGDNIFYPIGIFSGLAIPLGIESMKPVKMNKWFGARNTIKWMLERRNMLHEYPEIMREMFVFCEIVLGISIVFALFKLVLAI